MWQAGMAEHGLCHILPEQKPYIINGNPVHSKLTLNIQKQQTQTFVAHSKLPVTLYKL